MYHSDLAISRCVTTKRIVQVKYFINFTTFSVNKTFFFSKVHFACKMLMLFKPQN